MKLLYLRTLRERRGWTQDDLAARSRIAQNTISKLETLPNKRPIFETVVALAHALGVDPQVLRFGPDPRRRRRALLRQKDQVSA